MKVDYLMIAILSTFFMVVAVVAFTAYAEFYKPITYCQEQEMTHTIQGFVMNEEEAGLLHYCNNSGELIKIARFSDGWKEDLPNPFKYNISYPEN